ncbi:hypothetical protein GCM10019059_07410 [Camelimonas fluminis]|uniref:Phosphohydrolase n=1 Tax=Camelimonas fluminis TaxID=1576911 RepID=A0ABV7UFA4_9HYPH|nr:hypothetical protein [Camelimonas fluminis]GHE50831.1 hypothetical protein GCM10019059_07410 [Camelimonas fluminis]
MTWIQTSKGRAFDLLNPTPEMVDLKVDVAEALARIPRFGGHVMSGPYSVAQHCVVGADYLMQQTRDKTLAAAFLLHDAHEAYIGDMTSPVVQAISARMATPRLFGVVLGLLKDHLDAAIYAAAGMRWPLTAEVRQIIKQTDLALLRTERDRLLTRPPQPWQDEIERAHPLRLANKLKPQPWPDAAADYVDRLNRYCPLPRARAA